MIWKEIRAWFLEIPRLTTTLNWKRDNFITNTTDLKVGALNCISNLLVIAWQERTEILVLIIISYTLGPISLHHLFISVNDCINVWSQSDRFSLMVWNMESHLNLVSWEDHHHAFCDAFEINHCILFLFEQHFVILFTVCDMEFEFISVFVTFAWRIIPADLANIHVYIRDFILRIDSLSGISGLDIFLMVEADIVTFDSFSLIVIEIYCDFILLEASKHISINMVMGEKYWCGLTFFLQVLTVDFNVYVFVFTACKLLLSLWKTVQVWSAFWYISIANADVFTINITVIHGNIVGIFVILCVFVLAFHLDCNLINDILSLIQKSIQWSDTEQLNTLNSLFYLFRWSVGCFWGGSSNNSTAGARIFNFIDRPQVIIRSTWFNLTTDTSIWWISCWVHEIFTILCISLSSALFKSVEPGVVLSFAEACLPWNFQRVSSCCHSLTD